MFCFNYRVRLGVERCACRSLLVPSHYCSAAIAYVTAVSAMHVDPPVASYCCMGLTTRMCEPVGPQTQDSRFPTAHGLTRNQEKDKAEPVT